ncbi:MAG: hypothetical protein ACR2IG_07265 [Roseomonas sp.]
MFDVIFHADWSISKAKRWLAKAERRQSGWAISSVVIAPCKLTELLLEEARDKRVLAGFDFPIGVPATWATTMGIHSFPIFLEQLAKGAYPEFFTGAESKYEISSARPFYPARAISVVKQEHLYAAHGLNAFKELRRQCESRTKHRLAACPLFWTLGANQVGKGAISGWQEVVMPCVKEGARLWPFSGELELGNSTGLTIAETYPAEIYGWIDIKFLGKGGKKSQEKRSELIPKIEAWIEKRNIRLFPDVAAQLQKGFGSAPDGEDRFDAFCGICGMIAIAEGTRVSGAPNDASVRNFEGWILGQKVEDIVYC